VRGHQPRGSAGTGARGGSRRRSCWPGPSSWPVWRSRGSASCSGPHPWLRPPWSWCWRWPPCPGSWSRWPAGSG